MSETSAPAEDLLVIGKIVSVHGVRGDVKVYSFTDPIDNLLDYHAGRYGEARKSGRCRSSREESRAMSWSPA